jgi:hypothetical protein
MLLSAVLVDIYDLATGSFYWSTAIPPGMSMVLVVIALIIAELVLKNHGRTDRNPAM